MSLPIGHATIGFTAYSLFCGNGSSLGRWKVPLGILILSNLPDVDVVLGIVLQGNGSAFHRGPTHSLIFALVAGFLACRVWELWSQWPRLSFRICFLLILSHILADSVFTSSPISFFWPVTVNWSGGHTELRHVVNLVLFGNYQDVTIIFGCSLIILLHRTLRGFGAVILQK
jgi:inner membrane protein